MRRIHFYKIFRTWFTCYNLLIPSLPAITPELSQTVTNCPESCTCDTTKATCRGKAITTIPPRLPEHVTKLFLTETHISVITADDFANLTQLRELSFRDAQQLSHIQIGAFNMLEKLKILHIYDCSRLMSIPRGVFGDFRLLTHLRIWRSLSVVPDFSLLNTYGRAFEVIDLSNNYFEAIGSYAFSNVNTYELMIEGTRISRIKDRAFFGAQIVKLYLRGNSRLTNIDEYAFLNIQHLQRLDLSGTSITRLPINGLKDIEELVVTMTETLRVFPSVYSFSKIRQAHLTYPHHCCAFQNPDIQDPAKYEEFQQAVKCPQTTATYSEVTSGDDNMHDTITLGFVNNPRDGSRTKRNTISFWSYIDGLYSYLNKPAQDNSKGGKFGEFETVLPETGFGSIQTQSSVNMKPNIVDWVFHPGATVSVNESHTQIVLCGDVAKDYRDVVCTPTPDALNPCEDVMGYQWLRVMIWFVLLAAIIGNTVVIFVLLATKVKMSVTKFLMCNLAFGDLLMGVYLLLLASIDAHTLGVYFNHAITWQTEGGCQVAGFLTVLSSELSIYTLTVITMERWYAISHAIHLTKRLKLRQAAVIMAVGWLYAFLMAILPFLGISGYGTVSICLPMKLDTKLDLAYVLSLLIVNGLAFFAICMCYISMYYHVKGNDNSIRNGDATIAKRMALLVFTNFACWAPIAFFGLTASAGWPLIDITHSKILLVFFYPLNSCANPFLYAIFTKHFRRDLFILLSKYGICTRRANFYKGTLSKSVTQTRNTLQMHNPVTVSVSNDSALTHVTDSYLPHMSSTSNRSLPDDQTKTSTKSSVCQGKNVGWQDNDDNDLRKQNMVEELRQFEHTDEVIQEDVPLNEVKVALSDLHVVLNASDQASHRRQYDVTDSSSRNNSETEIRATSFISPKADDNLVTDEAEEIVAMLAE